MIRLRPSTALAMVPLLIVAGAVSVASSGTAGAAAPGQVTVGASATALTQPGDALLGRMAPAADADVKGMFGPQVGWPVIPVHASLLPNGNLVTYGTPVSEARQAGFTIDEWNPQQGMVDTAHTRVPSMASYDSFCSAMQMLPDGRVLMVGGNSTMSTMYYDPGSKTESMGPGLALERWYASVMRLQDDRILVLGGADYYNTGAYLRPDDNSGVALVPEIGNGTGPWTQLSGASSALAFGARDNKYWYPRTFIAPDGNVFGVSANEMWRLSTAGRGSITSLGRVPSSIGVSGAAVMYEPGRLMLAGGGQQFNEDAIRANAVTTLVNISGTRPAVTTASPMASPRNWHNLTVLPTGEVLANGGTIVGTQGGAANSAYGAEIWNPQSRTWRGAAAAKRIRTYHSTAALMPSGSVFTGGGGVPGPEDNFNSEMFYPPYLFTKGADGRVGWADRPALTSIAGSLSWGGSITVGTRDTRAISSVSLISAGNGTHSVNQDQRRIPLTFTRNGASLNVSIPSNKNTVPPGTYLLQAVDSRGVPSPSQLVTLRNNAAGQVNVYGADLSGANGVGGPGPAVAGSVPLTVGSRISFEAVGFPGYRLRHNNYAARLEEVGQNSADAAKADATFTVRAGLASPTGFSFEAVNFPGYFLRNENGNLVLRQGDGSAGFAGDATFLAVTGLTGQNTSLALFTDPSRYVRHANFGFLVQPFDGSGGGRADATLAVRAGLAPAVAVPTTTVAPPTTTPPTTTIPPTTTPPTTTPPTTTTTTVAPTTTTPPPTGPTLPVGSNIGLEATNFAGYRLRHYNFEARLEQVNAASPDVVRADSTFTVRTGLSSASGYSFEAVNFPGYFLRVENGAVFLRKNDGSRAFGDTATFLAVTGLTGQNTSLQLYSDPTKYLRHANFRFYAQVPDGSDVAKADSTFVIGAG